MLFSFDCLPSSRTSHPTNHPTIALYPNMNASSSELVGILNRCQADIAAILRQDIAVLQKAAHLAELLHELLPHAALTACLLRGEGADCLAFQPESKVSGSESKRLLPSQLSSLDPVARGVQNLRLEGLPNLPFLAAAIHERERPRGFLVLGLPGEASIEDRARAEVVLTLAAPAVALHWMLETLQRERAELERFALIGQAFAGLGHDLNNALNSMMLQTSVVQLRVDPQIRQELAAIRQHGAQAAALVRSLQHVIHERRQQSYNLDLNGVLAEVLEDEPNLRRRLSVTSAPSPGIQSTRSALKQLIVLLLKGLCAGTKAPVQAAVGEEEGAAVLSLTIADAAADLGIEGGASVADALLWQNLDEVSRHAGQSLLRQLGGTLTEERANDGTLILRIAWRSSL